MDYKTGYSPDARWYDISGQADLYAYVYEQVKHAEPEWIVYDCISDEGIYRHQRKPRDAKSLFNQVANLADITIQQLLEMPHPVYTCPTHCDFFVPCWLLETADNKAYIDYLEENFLT